MPSLSTPRRSPRWKLLIAAIFLPHSAAVPAQPVPAGPSWTDLADLALAAPVVLVGQISEVDRLPRKETPGLPANEVRALVQADLSAALRSPSVLPRGAAWLWQGPADARGRPPFGKETPVLVFARPLSGGARPEVQALQLVSADAQVPWSAQAEADVRAILQAARQPGAAGLMVTGVRDAFHSEGDVPGASESQFFLRTEGGRPISLVVRRMPDAQPQVLAASGDLVDGAAPVAPQTLLWRALACGLPANLPDAFAGQAALAADYALALGSLGPCGRRLSPPA